MTLPTPISRRAALSNVACGFGGLALSGMLANTQGQGAERNDPYAPKTPHFAPKAKRIIFIFMQGGPSQVDTFDYKPILEKMHREKRAFDDARTIANSGKRGTQQTIMKSPWSFKQYGECGLWASEIFSHTAEHADKLCMIHSMHTDGVAHGPATLFLHCGATNFVRPSLGSWITYGLGSESENLPGFISICPSAGNGGARNYGNAFLPPAYQATRLGTAGAAAKTARIRDLTNNQLSRDLQKEQFQLLQQLNKTQAGPKADAELEAVIASYELAWRMQGNAPDILDLEQETKETLDLYGINEKDTDDFGRKCLMARRFSEAGVRFVQVTYGDNSANPAWDQTLQHPQARRPRSPC